MEYRTAEEFAERLGEDFLWNVISYYVEHDVEHIKDELRAIPRVDGDIDKITSAEIQTSDEFIVTDYHSKDGILTVQFDMPAIIMAHSADNKVYYKVTTSCVGTVEVPDMDSYDWKAIDFENMFLQDILSYSHLAKIISVSYEYTEADDLNA